MPGGDEVNDRAVLVQAALRRLGTKDLVYPLY